MFVTGVYIPYSKNCKILMEKNTTNTWKFVPWNVSPTAAYIRDGSFYTFLLQINCISENQHNRKHSRISRFVALLLNTQNWICYKLKVKYQLPILAYDCE